MGVALNSSTFPRGQKLLVDGGVNPVVAAQRFEKSRLKITVGDDASHSRAGQCAALTAVVTAARAFGRVAIEVAENVPLLVRGSSEDLRSEMLALGGTSQDEPAPTLAIGNDAPCDDAGKRVVLDGATAGVGPPHTPSAFDPKGYVLAAILGASLGVLDLFRAHVLEEAPALIRARTYDLLSDAGPVDYLSLENGLPMRLGFLGIGHLGQGALFVATMITPNRRDVEFAIVDDGDVQPANESTQVLLHASDTGPKVAVCAKWLNRRKITVVPISKRFDGTFDSTPYRVGTWIAGFHDGATRQQLTCLVEQGNFVVDAGIGATKRDYTAYRIHTFPQKRSPNEVFRPLQTLEDLYLELNHLEIYRAFSDDPVTQCGNIEAGKAAVGVPFIGTAIAALSLNEVIKMNAGIRVNPVLSGDLTWSSMADNTPCTINASPA